MEIDVESMRNSLPAKVKGSVSKEIFEKVKRALEDNDGIKEFFQENFINYANVINSGKYTLQQYTNAVMFVSLILSGLTDREAYVKIFPERAEKFNWDECKITNNAASFKKSKLVCKLMEYAIIPSWILNQGAYQKAINTQVYLMENARSEMVRCKAAQSLLENLKKPEEVKNNEININVHTEIDDLREIYTSIAKKQLEYIKNGGKLSEVIEAVTEHVEK